MNVSLKYCIFKIVSNFIKEMQNFVFENYDKKLFWKLSETHKEIADIFIVFPNNIPRVGMSLEENNNAQP
jgi:hypothetical protein